MISNLADKLVQNEKKLPAIDSNIKVHDDSRMRESSLRLLATYVKLRPRTSTHIEDPHVVVVVLISDASNHIDLNIIRAL